MSILEIKIIYYVCVIILLIFSVRMIIDFLRFFVPARQGVSDMKILLNSDISKIRLKDEQYDGKALQKNIISLIELIFVLYIIFRFNSFFKSFLFFYYVVWLIVCSVGVIFKIIYSKTYGSYAYLTKSYITSFEGTFRKSDSRITIESEITGEYKRMYVTVRKDKPQITYRFQIIENEEEAVDIIEQYYQAN